MDRHQTSAIKGPRLSTAQAAPWVKILPLPVTSVEHPIIVKNISKAINTLGGPKEVKKLVELQDPNVQATLFLNPEDRTSKAIYSKNVAAQNLLLRITLPKRTGRKRKRGTDGPFQDTADHESDATVREARITTDLDSSSRSNDARNLLQRLQDNVGRYDVQLVGPIEQTHRFRTMPDFVYSTTNSTFMKNIREHILPFSYDKMKDYKFDLSKGPGINTELIPPPSFTHLSLPFNYSYKQNPATKQALDGSGKLVTIHTQGARKVLTQVVAFDIETVPNQPPSDAFPVESLEGSMKLLVELVQRHFDERPIWTRRALSNQINHPEWNALNKHVYQYAGYTFRSGPWRETLIKFGLDPRSDPCYRVHQTLTFQFDVTGSSHQRSKRPNERRKPRGGARKGTKARDEKSHLFDGVNLAMDGKAWQVCDITDPMLKSMLATTNLRTHCEISKDGWYHNGTWAKAKIIMKAKMSHIAAGKGDPQVSDYVQIAALPDVLDSNTKQAAIFMKQHATAQEIELAALLRRTAGPPEMTGDEVDPGDVITRQLTQDVHGSSAKNVEAGAVTRVYESREHGSNETLEEFELVEQETQDNGLVGFLDDDIEGNWFPSSGEDEMEEVDDDEGDDEE